MIKGFWGAMLQLAAVIYCLVSGAAHADHRDLAEGNKLNPVFEGVYEVHIRCERVSPHCSHERLEAWDRLIIVDSRLSVGVWLTFASSTHGEITDRYLNSKVTPSGDGIIALPRFGAGSIVRFAYIDIHFDQQTGRLSGEIVAQDTFLKYRIEGKPISTVHEMAKTKPPLNLNAEQIEGVYHGQLGQFKGKLVIKAIPNGHVVGHFASFQKAVREVPLLEMDFHSGEWEQDLGVLILSMQLKNLIGQGLLALSFRSVSNGQLVLSGFQAAGFKNNPARFVRVAP